MNKARITVQVTQRQPTKSPPDQNQPFPDQNQPSPHLDLASTDMSIPLLGNIKHDGKQSSQAHDVASLMQSHMQMPNVESPYLDEWSSWIAHEPMAIQSDMDIPNRSKMVWFQLGISIGGAVLTGLLIGLFMMKLFHYKPDERMVSSWSSEVPAQSYTFIQSGVFQSTDSAQKAQLALQRKGFSSYLTTGDKHTIFVGFAITQEDAKSLASILSASQVDVFLKKIDIPPCSAGNSQFSSGKLWPQLIEQSNQLIRLLHDVTITQMKANAYQPVNTETIQTIVYQHKVLRETSTQFKDVNSHMNSSEIDTLLHALQQAITSLQAYHQQAMPSLLWSIQCDTMQAILIQKQLLERLS